MIMTGGCLCGQVRYSVTQAPVMTLICHCRNCQKQSGAAFSVNIGVPAVAVSLQGKLRTFLDHGDTGRPVSRQFCPDCGSPILSEIEPAPDMFIIKAGTLDDPSAVTPQIEYFCDSAQPWVSLTGERQRLPRQ